VTSAGADDHALGRSDGAKRRIVHIITGLSRGGAEGILFQLICATRESWDCAVISLTTEGYYGERLRALGVNVICCRMNSAAQGLPGLLRLLGGLRRLQPDVVQTWMYHADLLGGVAARLLGVRAIVWGIRNFRLDRGNVSWTARAASRLCARISGIVPAAIVSCSAQAAAEHRDRGYASNKMLVIPNGYDARRLRRDVPAGQRVRTAWGVLPDQFLIGMVARWDPLKDHANLLAALQLLERDQSDVRCVLVGPGMEIGNSALAALLRRYPLASSALLAGPRDDIPAVMSALDLHVLSSSSEAFPNVVGEAMACGTPCVVTDVGDAAAIVGDTGWCVPPADAASLHAALRAATARLSASDRESLGAACRERILQNFSVEAMVRAYERVWRRALGDPATGL
jgi:glycosyltransferase involved in cell wall biosynthesis